jgi:heterodisulfide reductase subunit C
MYSGTRLCDPSKCNICTTVCPTGALSKYGEKEARRVVYKYEKGDKIYDYCHVNMTRCRIGAQGLMSMTGVDKDLVSSVEASTQEVDTVAMNMRSPDGGLQGSPTWRCGRCLAYCPAGNWKTHFKERGLSDHLPV